MSLVELATRRRVTVGMVTLTLVLFGLIALSGLKVNLLPDLTYPTLTVRTAYEGAAPAEIETLISQPVEEALGVVKNVRTIHSVSQAGQSDVILQFAWGTNMDQASLDVRDKLDLLQLPLTAKKPVLLRFNPATDPILRLALTGPAQNGAAESAELKQLRRFADDELRKRLEPTAGVAAVKVGGGLEDQIDVDIDQQRLQQLNLNVADVIKRLGDENVNVSGGRIEDGTQRYLVRTVNQFTDLSQMSDLLIKVDKGVPIRLKDVANVHQGHKEREGIVRVDGHEAVELAIYKEGDANTVTVAAAVRKQLAKFTCTNQPPPCASILPPNAKLTMIDDQSVFIQSSLNDVRDDAVIGGVLAVLIIFFFLADSWSTFIISLSLPVSLIATFFFMGEAGLSLNVMSLGGLALATGMVVDDSIVVLENIARMRERGIGIVESAVQGAREVSMAVTASTLTTVAVFFPLVFVQGIAGQLFRDQALTITFAMLISLVVAMSLIPMLASLKGRAPLAFADEAKAPRVPPRTRIGKITAAIGRLFRWLPRALGWIGFSLGRLGGTVIGRILRLLGKGLLSGYNRAATAYHGFLPKALAHPWKVLGFAAAMFAVAVALIPTLGTDLIPQLAQGRFEMTVKQAPGTPLADTDALVRELQAKNAKNPLIKMIYGVSGTGTRLDANPTESGENIARLLVVLAPGAGRKGESEAMNALRASMVSHPGSEVQFSRPKLFSFDTPLEVDLRGYDLDALQKAGNKLASLLQASPRFADVKSSAQGGSPEIRIHFDQDRAAALGLTTKQISDQIVDKIRGAVATQYNFRDRKIDVLVRAKPDERTSIDDIRNLIVNPGAATPVRLASVADVTVAMGPNEINRIGQERVAIVTANLHYGDLGSAVAEVRDILREHPLAAGVSAHIGGQSEELDASLRSLIFALSLAIFLVYLVMASQFESLLHPFVIMFSIPLALVGAVLALKITFTPLSIVVFIGLIMLAGIVVKNAIVLIDRINQLREEGVDKLAAIAQAAESRLRPITMTTLCTLLGFMPLALSFGDGSEVRSPMAIAVIGGLSVSTLLTLIVIPVVYNLLDRRADAWYRERGLRHSGHSDGAEALAEGGAP
ncbi:MAG TPA: efflux RND transporter permease subunit [Rudaea sp.]|nr:efflux RND transporter permease subunit [Rudaea sp.]